MFTFPTARNTRKLFFFFFFLPLFLSSSGALALYQENLLEFQRANPQKNAAPGALTLLGDLSTYLVSPPGEPIKLCLTGFTCPQILSVAVCPATCPAMRSVLCVEENSVIFNLFRFCCYYCKNRSDIFETLYTLLLVPESHPPAQFLARQRGA